MADNRKIACEATLPPIQALFAKLKSVPYRFAAAELRLPSEPAGLQPNTGICGLAREL